MNKTNQLSHIPYHITRISFNKVVSDNPRYKVNDVIREHDLAYDVYNMIYNDIVWSKLRDVRN